MSKASLLGSETVFSSAKVTASALASEPQSVRALGSARLLAQRSELSDPRAAAVLPSRAPPMPRVGEPPHVEVLPVEVPGRFRWDLLRSLQPPSRTAPEPKSRSAMRSSSGSPSSERARS